MEPARRGGGGRGALETRSLVAPRAPRHLWVGRLLPVQQGTLPGGHLAGPPGKRVSWRLGHHHHVLREFQTRCSGCLLWGGGLLPGAPRPIPLLTHASSHKSSARPLFPRHTFLRAPTVCRGHAVPAEEQRPPRTRALSQSSS